MKGTKVTLKGYTIKVRLLRRYYDYTKLNPLNTYSKHRIDKTNHENIQTKPYGILNRPHHPSVTRKQG
jgi:hypothetical protein